MGWPQFLAWAATQGFKNIKVLRQAYNSFKKFPGKDVVLKRAKNLYNDLIKKTSTKDIADKVRQKIKEDKLIIPKEFNRFKPEIVPKKGMFDNIFTKMYKDVMGPPKIVPKIKIVPKKPNPLGDALKAGKYKKVPTPKKLTPKTEIKDLQIGPHIDKQGRVWEKFVKPVPKGPAKIIPFPKKPPHLKAGGGRIDKALPGRSRDI